jgi:hypothetical protein
MVLRGRKSHRDGHGRYGLLSIRSFPHNIAGLPLSDALRRRLRAASRWPVATPAHRRNERVTHARGNAPIAWRHGRRNKDSRGAHASV